MDATTLSTATQSHDAGRLGYKTHSGWADSASTRDEYFAHISLSRRPAPHARSTHFLRALMRDMAWGFFYGTVNFDDVFGTVNHYGTVEMFVGLFNEGYRSANAITSRRSTRRS